MTTDIFNGRLRRVTSERVVEPPPGLWSNCKRVGNQVYVAGLVAMDGDGRVVHAGDAYRQASYVFENMRHLIIAAGGCMNDVATLNIYVTDMKHRPAVLEARRAFFTGDFPCSTLVAVNALIDSELMVEINAVAFIGASAGTDQELSHAS